MSSEEVEEPTESHPPPHKHVPEIETELRVI